jgi:hypothetical protein
MCIDVLEHSLILHGKKYIEWKVQLYLECARVLEEFTQFSFARKLLEKGLKNLLQHKSIYLSFQANEEDCSKDIFLKCEDYFLGLIMKFKLFEGEITVQDFIKGIKSQMHHQEMKTFALLEGLSQHGPQM